MYRQSDVEFLEFLSKVRDGSITDLELESFNEMIARLPPIPDLVGHVHICARQEEARVENEKKLNELGARLFEFPTMLEGEDPSGYSRTGLMEETLRIKIGAQVMFIKNGKDGLWVNGDVGKVTAIDEKEILVKTRRGEFSVEMDITPTYDYRLKGKGKEIEQVEVGRVTRFPLVLAWAITIHKMQGQTVESATIDLGRGAFDSGMTYVALSRVKSMEGLRLVKPLRRDDIRIDEACRLWLENALGSKGK